VKRFESRNEFSARRVSAVFLFHGTYFTKVAHARARARVSRCIRFIGSFLALTNHVSLMCILSDVKRTDIKTRASIDALADSRIARSQSTNTRSSPTSRRLKVARR